MATVYALMEFNDPIDGTKREPGDEIEWPTDTPEDQAELEKAISYKLVTKSASRGHKVAERAAAEDDGQRTARRKS